MNKAVKTWESLCEASFPSDSWASFFLPLEGVLREDPVLFPSKTSYLKRWCPGMSSIISPSQMTAFSWEFSFLLLFLELITIGFVPSYINKAKNHEFFISKKKKSWIEQEQVLVNSRITTTKLAEPSGEAVKVRCLRLSLLSETGTLLRPMKFVPCETGNLGAEGSSSKFWFSGTKYPTFKVQTKPTIGVKQLWEKRKNEDSVEEKEGPESESESESERETWMKVATERDLRWRGFAGNVFPVG